MAEQIISNAFQIQSFKVIGCRTKPMGGVLVNKWQRNVRHIHIRPVGISVAAMDYLANIDEVIEEPFKKDFKVTISSGVATCPLNAKSARAFITKADKALYQSKINGKNKVTFFQA